MQLFFGETQPDYIYGSLKNSIILTQNQLKQVKQSKNQI